MVKRIYEDYKKYNSNHVEGRQDMNAAESVK